MSSREPMGKEQLVQTKQLADGHVLTIRCMEPEDVPAVAKLEAETFSVPWSEKAFLEEVEREDRLFVVACVGETVAGYMGLISSFDEADITNVAVDSSLRRSGIAENMLKIAMKWAGERGINAFTLEVRAGNEGAIALYEKLGFVSEGIRKNFYEKPTEDALIMWKR